MRMRQVILNFHGIGMPARTLEPGEAAYWVSEAFFMHTLELANRHRSTVRTDFTFDDGNLSDATIAAPLLARHRLRAHIFVLADRIGQPGSLDMAAIRALHLAGHAIGNYGAAHINWTCADAETLAREIGAVTWDRIAAAAGAPVTTAAIPFGYYDAGVLRALRRQGYRRVYSSDGGAWKSRGPMADQQRWGSAAGRCRAPHRAPT